MSKKRRKTGGRGGARNGSASGGTRFSLWSPPDGPALLWLLVAATVFICLPGMMSGNFLPKTIWAAMAVALGFFVLRDRVSSDLAITPLGGAWLLYLGYALLSLLWAEQARVGFERWLALVLPTMAYLLARRTRFWESHRFWTLFCVGMSIFSLIGCLQFMFEDFPLVHWFPGTKPPRVTVGHRNYVGLFLMVTLPFTLYLWTTRKGRDAWIPGCALLLALLLMLFTRARSAWVATFAAFLFVLAAGGYLPMLFQGRRKYAFLGLIVVAVALAMLVGAPEELGLAKRSVLETATSIFEDMEQQNPRFEMWNFALSVPISRAIGCGFGSFPIVASPFSQTGTTLTLDWEVHNDYLQALLDLGIVGLAFFLIFWGCALYLVWKGRRNPLVVAAGASVVGLVVMQFFTFTSQKTSSIIWMAGALALLNTMVPTRPVYCGRISVGRSRALNWAATIGVGAFGILAIFSAWGDCQFRKVEAARAPDFERLAEKVLPWMQYDVNMVHTSCHLFSRHALRAGEPGSARIFAEKALALHPNDRVPIQILIQTAYQSGRTEEAMGLARRYVDTFGFSADPPYHQLLAKWHTDRGETEKSQAILKEAGENLMVAPQSPLPADRAIDMSFDAALRWQGNDAAEKYDLYLWKDGEETSSTPFREGLATGRADLDDDLEPWTTYFWKVRARSDFKSSPRALNGNLWVFRTAPAGERPITVPEVIARKRPLPELLRNATDIFTLYEIGVQYGLTDRSGDLADVYHEKFDALLQDIPRMASMNENVDLFAFDYRRLDENRCRVYYLFRIKKKMDRDYRIHLEGHVDTSHETLLPMIGRQRGVASFHFDPYIPTSQWPAGEFRVVRHDLPAKPLPYRMQTAFYEKGEGFHGKMVNLGWQDDLLMAPADGR
ncbi:O-antigen ligase family protein [bacterium]|nr:O-antigen ligase family protein [bacterium]